MLLLGAAHRGAHGRLVGMDQGGGQQAEQGDEQGGRVHRIPFAEKPAGPMPAAQEAILDRLLARKRSPEPGGSNLSSEGKHGLIKTRLRYVVHLTHPYAHPM
ncbi:hypothetical protein MASSI9I_51235 [Massilia sp. 9I]|nr:hypothetical protein MASSI9I_51235 [Massilia sp. 9I]